MDFFSLINRRSDRKIKSSGPPLLFCFNECGLHVSACNLTLSNKNQPPRIAAFKKIVFKKIIKLFYKKIVLYFYQIYLIDCIFSPLLTESCRLDFLECIKPKQTIIPSLSNYPRTLINKCIYSLSNEPCILFFN